jgi:hypothetical protein
MHPEHEVVQHIPDEAIEEMFPPSAEDVAEMEAADDFVETMAWLSYLDECDEQARFNFAGLKKRWEARREAGLVGKPHPPRERHHDDDNGMGRSRSGTLTSTGEMASSLVPYAPRIFEVKPRKVENRMSAESVPKNVRGVHGHSKGNRGLIQQPRKHN